MPKTMIAKNIASIGNIAFSAGSDGKLTAITVTCELNFGEMGVSQMVDIWTDLTLSQKTVAQNFYDRLKTILGAKFIS